MRLVNHYDQDERDSDGAVHQHTVKSKLIREFGSRGARDFLERDWPQQVYEGNDTTSFEYCVNSENSLMYIRAIQGHTGGNMIAPELMGQVAIFPAILKSVFSTEVVLSASSPALRQNS